MQTRNVLKRGFAVGKDLRFGASARVAMLSGVDGTVATLAPFVNVNSTDDATPGLLLAVVLVPITTTTVVALAYVHVAEVPPLGVAPTFAVHLQHESTVRVQHMPRNTWQKVTALSRH